MLLIPTIGISQNKGEVTAKKAAIEKRIQLTNDLLKGIRQDRNNSSQTLKTLKHQIQTREGLLITLQDEIADMDHNIFLSGEEISSLQTEVTTIRSEYDEILRAQYRQHLVTNQKWLYLLSAKSLKDLMLRYTYSKRFEAFCKEKSDELKSQLNRINKKTETQLAQRSDKEQLMINLDKQRDELDEDMIQQDIIMEQLLKSENTLLANLKSKEREKNRLDDMIKNVIAAEANDIKVSESVVSKPVTKTNYGLSGQFGKNKGKLPWPVNNGIIINKFGKRNHEVLKNVKVYNNGIDIRTSPGSEVFSVFDGVVMQVVSVSAQGNMVLVRHDKYLTAYLNVGQVMVTKGEEIKAGETIGILLEQDGVSDLQFQIWKDKDKLNPSSWLIKK